MLQALAAAGGALPPVRMMLANDELKTVLVTIHVSLRRAIEAITFEAVLETIRTADTALRRFAPGRPRRSVAGRRLELGELLSRPLRRPLHQIGALDGAKAPGLAHAREHARGHRDRLLMLAAAREHEEAAPRADMGQLHLLPGVLQVHLVGEAELDVVDQLRPARRLARLARLGRRRAELLDGGRIELGGERGRR